MRKIHSPRALILGRCKAFFICKMACKSVNFLAKFTNSVNFPIIFAQNSQNCVNFFTFFAKKFTHLEKSVEKSVNFPAKTPTKSVNFSANFTQKSLPFANLHLPLTNKNSRLTLSANPANSLQKFAHFAKAKIKAKAQNAVKIAQKFTLFALFCAFFAACATKERPNYAVLDLPQSVQILPKPRENAPQINADDYKRRFFAPWHFEPKMSVKARQSLENALFQGHKAYANPKNDFYFFNKQKIPPAFLANALKNANAAAFLSANRYAIVIANTLLKNIPTHTAILRNPFLQNEGVPFDYALDSVLNVGAAVFVSHFSLDKRYAFVLCESGWGFVEAKNLEFISKNEREKYENSRFFTPLKEHLALYDENGNFAFETRIGGIYPFESLENGVFKGCIGKKCYEIETFSTQNSVNFLTNSANPNQNSVNLNKAKNENSAQNFGQNLAQNSHQNSAQNFTPKSAKNSQNSVNFAQNSPKNSQILAQNVAEFPLKWNEKSVKTLIYQLLGRPYGWGGYDFERDCSALLRDFFAAFGAWLPRNSHAQAHFWHSVDVSGLNAGAKKRLIARYAKPYETLLHFKGHIMLYVGSAKLETSAVSADKSGANAEKFTLKNKVNSANAEKNELKGRANFSNAEPAGFENKLKFTNAEPIVFHAAWGLRASDGGRLLIAKTALTTLEIGKNDEFVIQEMLFLNRLERLTFLHPSPQTTQQINAFIKKFTK